MRSLFQSFKNAFLSADSQPIPATCNEMTLHDALRSCSKDKPNSNGNSLRQIPAEKICVYRYRSEPHFHSQWRRLQATVGGAKNVTVFLALGECLGSNLRDLIRWNQQPQRLVLVPQLGHWPGRDSLGDLALSPESHGWQSIEMSRDLAKALSLAIASSSKDNKILVVMPVQRQSRRYDSSYRR